MKTGFAEIAPEPGLSSGISHAAVADRTLSDSAGPADDSADVRLSLNGDGDAYARLMKRHQGRVAARMWRFTRDRTTHERLVQDVFVQAYLSLKSFRGEAPFEHWLARVVTRIGYKHWKRKSKERSERSVSIDEIAETAALGPTQIDAVVAGDLLHRLLGSLAPRDRLALVLRYVEGHSVEETARLTGWSQTMVKVQVWRARKKLKKTLSEAGLEV